MQPLILPLGCSIDKNKWECHEVTRLRHAIASSCSAVLRRPRALPSSTATSGFNGDLLSIHLTLLSRGLAGIPFDMFSAIGIPGGVRGGGNPPGMGREAPKGKRKSQGRSRYCEIAQSSLKHYPGCRSCRCRLRCPNRKQEKPREVNILWNSSAEPGPKPHKSATARPPPRLGGLWPVARN